MEIVDTVKRWCRIIGFCQKNCNEYNYYIRHGQQGSDFQKLAKKIDRDTVFSMRKRVLHKI